ncbi:tetratricopeptide repeat protein [Ancylomarina sp. 16SWW S1-10-2]|uniref:tetratricopeptide repeat protein n=1 Tax=Ancylomarina sp. 16SWW S1-10-2 TaxID=2499681 RepID=UPI0012AE886F|nr:tetratricopeptide repeat protein [Ancylomarina sp. 16SWW S1-10-2]MRT94789.1 tetratricopeptide repeat protein [Ancylomarina sp. 16SWW S1-10-2]
MRKFIYTLIALALSIQVFAQTSTNPIQEANDFYQKGEYEEAIKSYESVLETRIEAPEIYFNLANAYYKTGQIAPSILNYERALLLSPDDEDIKYNLELARKNVTDKLEVLPEFFVSSWVSGLWNSFSASVWSYLSIGFFLIFLALISLYLYSKQSRIKKLGFFLSILCLLSSLVSYNFASRMNKQLTLREYAIVFNPSVTVKGSPDESGTQLFLLHEGTKIKVIEELGDWCNIKISDGNQGWIKKEDIEII